MGYLADEVICACFNLSYNANILNSKDSQNVISIVKNNFCLEKKNYPIWESIIDSKGIQDPNGWQWISEFVNNKPILIFFEQSDDQSIVRIENGFYISKILGECFGFVFYITDINHNYLICFNDHNILIGAGTATDWIEKKKLKQ
ncbi:MAG: hypothetical protein ACRC2S_03105 [Waterburya sp.]